MNIVSFDSHHVDLVDEWLIGRGLEKSIEEEIPETGFIVFGQAFGVPVGICAGFIRLVEGGFGLLDSYVSNPKVEGLMRHVALDTLTKRLLATAKMMGITKLIAYSVDEGTLERASRHGFRPLEHKVISLDLTLGGGN